MQARNGLQFALSICSYELCMETTRLTALHMIAFYRTAFTLLLSCWAFAGSASGIAGMAVPLERVAQFIITADNDYVRIRASFQKSDLELALNAEGNCTPEDQWHACADKYIREHIAFQINGKPREFVHVKQQEQEQELIIEYIIKLEKPMRFFMMNCDYLQAHNKQAVTSVMLTVNEKSRQYSMHSKMQRITANF